MKLLFALLILPIIGIAVVARRMGRAHEELRTNERRTS